MSILHCQRAIEQLQQEERQRDLFRSISNAVASFGKNYEAAANWIGASMNTAPESDKRVYRDWLAAAEHFANEPPVSQLGVGNSIDAVLAAAVERREKVQRARQELFKLVG